MQIQREGERKTESESEATVTAEGRASEHYALERRLAEEATGTAGARQEPRARVEKVSCRKRANVS